MQRRQYIIAEYTTAGGVLQLPNTSGPVPVKSNTAVCFFRSIVTCGIGGRNTDTANQTYRDWKGLKGEDGQAC